MSTTNTTPALSDDVPPPLISDGGTLTPHTEAYLGNLSPEPNDTEEFIAKLCLIKRLTIDNARISDVGAKPIPLYLQDGNHPHHSNTYESSSRPADADVVS